MTILTYKGINKTGLACIRTANHSKTGNPVFSFVALFLRQHLQHLIQEIASTATCRCTDGERITKSELIEFVLVIEILPVVGFVDNKHYRQFCST